MEARKAWVLALGMDRKVLAGVIEGCPQAPRDSPRPSPFDQMDGGRNSAQLWS